MLFVTTLDRKDYIQKCVSILNTSQFQKPDNDPTKADITKNKKQF